MKLHKKPLTVKAHCVGLVQLQSEALLARAKLSELANRDMERMMLEESKSKVKWYIHKIKNKLADDEEAVTSVPNNEQEVVRGSRGRQKLADAAGEWHG
jgi:hypothetical protein